MASARKAWSGFEDPYESLTRRSPEHRIRAILGLPSGSFLPPVNLATLRKYYQYLASRLTLPFEAQYSAETERVVYPATVVALVDPGGSSCDFSAGLCCVAYVKDRESVLPLVEMELAEDSPNFQIIEDYWYWVWNSREACSDAAPPRRQQAQ